MNLGNQKPATSTKTEYANDAIAVVDPKTWRFLEMNAKGCQELGYTREEILSLTLPDVYPAMDFPAFAERLEKLGQTGSTKLETLRRCKDGSTSPVEVSFHLMRLEREYVVAIARNITDTKGNPEEVLERERALLRTVIDLLPDPIYVKDLESLFLLGNLAVVDNMGAGGREALIGTSDKDYFSQEQSAGFRKDELAVMAGQPLLNKEESINHPDGTQRFILTTKVPLKDIDGKIIGLVGIGRDITERKRAEEKFDRERILLRTVIDLLPDHIYVKDVDSRFVLANLGVAQVMGVARPEDLIGRLDTEFYSAEDAAEFRRDELEVLNGRPMYNKEEPLTHPDGTRRFILCTKVPLKDSSGKFIGVVGIGRDFTARKRVEAELERSVSLLAATLESTADGILALDIEGKVVSFNQRFLNLWRIPAEAAASPDHDGVLGLAIEQLEEAGAFAKKLRESNVRPEPESSNTLRLKDGRVFEYYSHPQRLDGQTVGRVWSFRDVTERRQLEGHLRQVQKMESVGQLAAGIAHDFNNLLTVIQGYGDVLRAELANRPHAAECLEQIAAASERAANLTRQLLLFSRKQVALRHLFDLNELTGNLTKMLGRILGEDIDLQLGFQPGLPPVYADPGMIEQVIINLAVNARDAMPDGGRLEITTSAVDLDSARVLGNPEAQPGPFVCLEVKDTGAGIAPENLPKIFEPFFTTKEIGKGTGLGLATVYGIVMQHQGVLEVASEPGKGASFHIYLPAASRAETAATAGKAAESARGGSETILLVEDEQTVLALVKKILTDAGYKVFVATSGGAAEQVWKEHEGKIDLLLTDMVMPGGFSGKRLAGDLKTQQPKLPVIYMSGYSPELRSLDLDIKEGLNFLQKPFSKQALLEAVRRQLDSPR